MKKITVIILFIIPLAIGNYSLFTILSAQIINTVAGIRTVAAYSGDGGPATAAELNAPAGVCIDHSGGYFIADEGNSRIRRVNNSGIISTFAGDSAVGYSGDGGPATAAELSEPISVAFDKFGNLYIADNMYDRIRKVNSSGIITTIAGNGISGYFGDGGPATAAELGEPLDVAVDDFGNVFIADWINQVIRKVNTSGIISTFAGDGYRKGTQGGFSGDGGPATAAMLNQPYGVAVDDSNNVYIADRGNCRIRKVNISGIITTIAGIGYRGFSGDGGPATLAKLNYPIGVAIDHLYNIYIVDNANGRIREVNTSGIINTIAGVGVYGFYSGDGGPATAAEIDSWGIGIDTSDNVYITNCCSFIREIYMHLNIIANGIGNVSCYGVNNGTANIIASDGLMPYTYSWSNGSTGSSLTDLSAGTYTIQVTDSENVNGSTTVTITQPSAISITGDSINDSGGCNGSASLTVSGGTTPYSYLWAGGLTTDTITNQCVGNYCCLLTDAHGCKDSTCVIINSTVGIRQLSVDSGQWVVYPNPAATTLSVILPEAGGATFCLYNVLGEKVIKNYELRITPLNPHAGTLPPTPQGGLKQGAYQIDVSKLPEGVYFWRVVKEDGELVGEGKEIIVKSE